MEQHMLFFDIDGTLLVEDRGYIPQSAKIAIEKAKENGHLIFINSGRVRCAMETEITDLNPDGYICGCGSYIEYKGEVLLKRELGHSLSKQIATDMEQFGLEGILEGTEAIYFRNPCTRPGLERARKRFMESHKGFVKEWTDSQICFDKLAIWFKEDSDMEGFRQKYQDQFEFIRREIDFYEVIPQGYSKATGIQFMAEYLKIPLKNAVAIGDSTNDLSMLSFVEKSIAMGNSHPLLFDVVDYITTDILNHGIYNGLKHYGLIQPI